MVCDYHLDVGVALAEQVHVREVGVAHAHDENGEGQCSGLLDLLHRLLHVVDDTWYAQTTPRLSTRRCGGGEVGLTVGDDEEDQVRLLASCGSVGGVRGGLVDDLGEVGRSAELHLRERSPVALEQALDALGLRLLVVEREREAVGHAVPEWYLCAIPKRLCVCVCVCVCECALGESTNR